MLVFFFFLVENVGAGEGLQLNTIVQICYIQLPIWVGLRTLNGLHSYLDHWASVISHFLRTNLRFRHTQVGA